MKTGIFQLTEADRPSLEAHLLRLSPADRRLRFFCPMNDDAIRSIARQARMEHVQGYFVWDELVATAFLVPENRERAEFAVTVDAAHRGHGVAQELLHTSLGVASSHHHREVIVRHLTDNKAMAAVHRHLPSQRKLERGEVDVRIDLEMAEREEIDAVGRLCGAADA